MALEMRGGGNVLGLVVCILLSLLTFARAAPAYTTRHPRREPPCSNLSGATLCWTVQLKPPLHFRSAPAQISSQDSSSSVAGRFVDDGDQQRKNPGQTSPAIDPVKLSNMSVGNHEHHFTTSAIKNLSLLASSFVFDQSSTKLSFLAQLDIETNSSVTLLENGTNESRKEHDFLSGNKSGEASTVYRQAVDTRVDLVTETLHLQKVYVYRQVALMLAEEVGLSLLGKVGELYDHFVLCHDEQRTEDSGSRGGQEPGRATDKAFQHYHKAHMDLKNADTARFEEIRTQAEASLQKHHDVAWFTMETVHHRQKRSVTFNDPAFTRQWHLVNRMEPGMDINVTGVWDAGFTGKGVTVAVVDDGLEWNNPDLHDNYDFMGSWDLNDNDPDPMPNSAKVSNHHGTRCAGEIAAVANNEVCGVGVAYKSKVAGIRLLDGPMTDSLEAEAFNKKFDINAIYSCSWGPDDDGKTVDGPHILAAKAMKYGVEFGRHGYGSVFVVASGNGGSKQDNCNYDGYANSIYTVTIGAVDESGSMPYYAEECASMLGVTFSSGIASKRDIVTTDWLQKGANGCTERHTGTSAAAPLAAGMIALMLSAQPCLTWRDVQYILIVTSVKIERELVHWQKNGAGLEHSHKHGFGLISAWRMVNAARVWRSVPWMTSYSKEDGLGWSIPHGEGSPLIVRHSVTVADIAGYSLYMLEYVQVTVTLSHPVRGKLGIRLRCPSGTLSVIGAPRPNDNSTSGFTDWTFTTVRCWGEAPTGEWTLFISDYLPADSSLPTGHLTKWRLTLFGTPMTTKEFQQRRLEVEQAMSGEYLSTNHTPHCDPPPVTSPPYIPLSEKTLKILFLASVFCVVFALYETFEYMMCYGEEKRQQAEEDAQRAATEHHAQLSSEPPGPETTRLLRRENEHNDSWLRLSQSAFEEEEDDMFLLDTGTATRLHQARRAAGLNKTAGERIALSTFRTSPTRNQVPDSLQDRPNYLDTLMPNTSSGTSLNTRAAMTGIATTLSVHDADNSSPSLLSNQHNLASSRSENQAVMATESHLEAKPGKESSQNSILPDLWKSLSRDQDSDNDSLEDELFSRDSQSNVSLLRNGVRKSYR